MKKVLASVLAGSMVLGMAAAASAATGLSLKPSKNTDFDYQLYLYEPEFSSIQGDWAVDNIDEIKDNLANYTKRAKKFKSLTDGELTAIDAGTAYAVTQDEFNAMIDALAELHQSMTETTRVKLGMTAGVAVSTITDEKANWPTLASIKGVRDAIAGNNATWNYEKWDINRLKETSIGSGEYPYDNKDYVDIADQYDHHMYTYGEDDAKEVKFEIIVQYDEDFRVDVASGKVTVSKKRIERNKANDTDTYQVIIKAAAGVRDFELDDFKVEMDCSDANKIYFIEGDVAYSDYREVEPDERYIIKKSDKDDEHDDDGSIFNFTQVIDEETRIVCNDYVDLLFKGNYGTDFENLRVMTDDITEVEDFFQDYDIDYYDFIGTPKFAKDITVRIDADSDAYIYEYDKTSGDVVDITDECEYTSDGMTFKRKSLKTYVVLEEPYEGGNVKAEKEPVSEEPDDTDEPETEEPKDDPSNAGSKPNPGTGAYPLF